MWGHGVPCSIEKYYASLTNYEQNELCSKTLCIMNYEL